MLRCPCRKIKSGHIGDASRRELGDEECGRPAGRRTIAARPSPETDGYAPRYDISCKRAVRDGDAELSRALLNFVKRSLL